MSAGTPWQPENAADLALAIKRLEKELPGWWWRVGACHVSADATIAPDLTGPDAALLQLKHFDEGFDCDLRQPATCARALHGAIDTALRAKAALPPQDRHPGEGRDPRQASTETGA